MLNSIERNETTSYASKGAGRCKRKGITPETITLKGPATSTPNRI